MNGTGTAGPQWLGSVLVPLHVQGQMIGAGKAAVAHPALERLGPCVLPVVTGQLVRAREPPVAAFPGALVGLLTYERKKAMNEAGCLQGPLPGHSL